MTRYPTKGVTESRCTNNKLKLKGAMANTDHGLKQNLLGNKMNQVKQNILGNKMNQVSCESIRAKVQEDRNVY